ncbi:MAG: radical SAM protein [Pseudomonadota bacterium]
MSTATPGLWICREYCRYYKTNRTEEDRCRGYSLAMELINQRVLSAELRAKAPFSGSFEHDFLRSHVCRPCPFYVDDCDFTSPEPPEDCLPCGGLVLLSGLLKEGKLTRQGIRDAFLPKHNPAHYLSLASDCAIKRLETDHLYHVGKDELYEVNDEAYEMLARCDGRLTAVELSPDPEFLEFCIDEGLLALHERPATVPIVHGRSSRPSLRYLEWLVTFRCNLACAHCYLGDPHPEDFPAELIRPLLEQFSLGQGLRVLVSGGEPTIYRHFELLNDVIKDYPIRAVLLTNGTLMDERTASGLNFHEVQVSLDGMEEGHELIRGKGTFSQAVAAMKAVRAVGLDLSVATMVHRGNVGEWTEMERLVTELGAREWSIDQPCFRGRWESHHELAVCPAEAAEKMAYGFGGSYHGTDPGWTCGRHLAAVLPSGNLCPCGLCPDRTYGHIAEGLEKAWERVEHVPIAETLCADCPEGDICGGGCRFRAGDRRARDEVMCRLHGVDTDAFSKT